jgi:hypothetical protein
MKCPCGCDKEVPNGRYFATDECRRNGNKNGVFMPKSDCRSEERKRKKLYSLRKGRK